MLERVIDIGEMCAKKKMTKVGKMGKSPELFYRPTMPLLHSNQFEFR